jgi:hypothetical protein
MTDTNQEIERSIGAAEKPKPQNDSMFRGLKKQMITHFVRYLKDNCPGQVKSDLNIMLEPMTFTELDQVAQRFLESLE